MDGRREFALKALGTPKLRVVSEFGISTRPVTNGEKGFYAKGSKGWRRFAAAAEQP